MHTRTHSYFVGRTSLCTCTPGCRRTLHTWQRTGARNLACPEGGVRDRVGRGRRELWRDLVLQAPPPSRGGHRTGRGRGQEKGIVRCRAWSVWFSWHLSLGAWSLVMYEHGSHGLVDGMWKQRRNKTHGTDDRTEPFFYGYGATIWGSKLLLPLKCH
jgi:hypothetical protein